MTARQRTIAACHADALRQVSVNWLAAKLGREPIEAPQPVNGPMLDMPLGDRLVAAERLRMGEERWAQRNAEWENAS